MEAGARVVGTLVQHNRGMEGYGIYGGGTMVNCTVVENESAENPMSGVRPGWIYVEGDSAISVERWLAAYEAGTTFTPIGVVFWVNSDVYSSVKGYAMALDENTSEWGAEPLSTQNGFAYAVDDTSSYANTRGLEGISDPADYCMTYGSTGARAGHWVLPAGYQLAQMYAARGVVNASLAHLQGKWGCPGGGDCVQPLTETYYWSSTETDLSSIWGVNFGDETGGEQFANGAFVEVFGEIPQGVPSGWSWDTWQAVVRPVFAF